MRNDKTSWTDGSILHSANCSKVNSLCVNEHSQLRPENYRDNLDSFSLLRVIFESKAKKMSLSKIHRTPKKAAVPTGSIQTRHSFSFLCLVWCCGSPGV